ncbi:MAG: transposase, partial [Holophagaceae bacterium]|nr:transposase [Holophagaceae bacterium]
IDSNKRRGDKKQMCPAKKTRYKERSAVERAFSNLKDNYGGRFIRVKGAAKVMAHLMFGVLALTAAQLCRLVE